METETIEKDLTNRLQELKAQQASARAAVDAERERLIAGTGNVQTLTEAQSTYNAICETVAEVERRELQLQRERDEQRRQAERDELQARLKVLCDADRDDERGIAASIARAYEVLDNELNNAAAHYCRSNERQAEMARLRAQNGESVQPFPTHTPERIARLGALFEADARRSQLFAGSVRVMLNHVLDERSRRA